MSIRENIVQDLKHALEMMSEGAGYHYDWSEVYLYPPGEVHGWPSLWVSDGLETMEDLAYPLVHRNLEVEIQAVHAVVTSPTDGPDTAARRMIEDIERCVMADPQRGNNAVDTRLVRAEPPIIGDDSVHVLVVIEVRYRTHRQDPTKTT